MSLNKSLTELKSQHETLLERHNQLVEKFDLLEQSYKTSVTSHKSVLEKHTVELDKVEKKTEEQAGKLEVQQEETRKGFKSLTNHIMNHIAENNANLEKANRKEKAESEEKLKGIVENIHKQLKDHGELHGQEKCSIQKNSDDLKNLKTNTESQFNNLDKIEEARKLEEKEEKKRLRQLEKQSFEGLEKLNSSMESVQAELKSNDVERQAIRQDLFITKDEINREVINIKKEIAENASKDENTERTLTRMKQQIEIQNKQNIESQNKVNHSLKMLTEKSTELNQGIEAIKSETIEEESRRRTQEGKFQNNLDGLKKELTSQRQELASIKESKRASDEKHLQEEKRLEVLIEKSEERQRSVSDNLLEKIETTRELLGQSQRGMRAIIREECDAVASSSRADNFEVSLIS